MDRDDLSLDKDKRTSSKKDASFVVTKGPTQSSASKVGYRHKAKVADGKCAMLVKLPASTVMAYDIKFDDGERKQRVKRGS